MTHTPESSLPAPDKVTEAHREFVAWVDRWVSNPVLAYSVAALDGLFAATRDRIAALTPLPARKQYCQCKSSVTNPCIVCGLPKFIDREWLKRKIEEDGEEGEIGAGFEMFPLPAPVGGEAVPQEAVAWQWRAVEDGYPRTSWKDEDIGDLIGWQALMKRNPKKFTVERRPLYAAPPAKAAGVVTDAMVEAAHAEYHKVLGDPNRSDPMRAALQASTGGAETGMVSVPREPTPEMFGAGGVQQFKCDFALTPVREAVGLVYRAMVDAALAASPEKEGKPSGRAALEGAK